MKGGSEKVLKQKKKESNESESVRKKRFLVTVNVLGSAGPIRFVVNEGDNVSGVIDTALKLYARAGRLPVLGSDVNNFLLYPANAGMDALKASEMIGSSGARNFVMCKKQSEKHPQMTEARSDMISRKGGGIKWRAWFSFKISSH